jgi:hypothetical protein
MLCEADFHNWDALDSAHVKLGRPDATTNVVEPSSKTVRSALLNDTPRVRGAVESGIHTHLVLRGGVVAPW